MSHPVTIFTGQWADLPLAELAPRCLFGDGLNWHAGATTWTYSSAEDPKYCKARWQYWLRAAEVLGYQQPPGRTVGQRPNDDSRSDNFGMLPKSRSGMPKEAQMGDFIDVMCPCRKEPGHFGCERLHRVTDLAHALQLPPVSTRWSRMDLPDSLNCGIRSWTSLTNAASSLPWKFIRLRLL